MPRITSEAAKHYRNLADRFSRETGKTTFEVHEVVSWADRGGELELSPEEIASIHAGRLSEALRSDVATDDKKRTYRLRHCMEAPVAVEDGKFRQRTLWAHIDEATDDFLIVSLQQRRKRIADDVESLRMDLEIINERRVAAGKRPIQLGLAL